MKKAVEKGLSRNAKIGLGVGAGAAALGIGGLMYHQHRKFKQMGESP